MSTSLPNFSPLSLPKIVGAKEWTLASFGCFLHSSAAPAPGQMEKMLTPIEEKACRAYPVSTVMIDYTSCYPVSTGYRGTGNYYVMISYTPPYLLVTVTHLCVQCIHSDI